jgi:hypothetical protein
VLLLQHLDGLVVGASGHRPVDLFVAVWNVETAYDQKMRGGERERAQAIKLSNIMEFILT